MILTASTIERMRRHWEIDERLEKMLLAQLGSEPYPHVYTEQDLHEQSRKMIMQYNRNSAVAANNRRKPDIARKIEYTKQSGGDIPKANM